MSTIRPLDLLAILRKGRPDAVAWAPDPKSAFFSSDSLSEGSTKLLCPSWLLDDGNLLFACLDASKEEEVSARAIEKTGRIVQQACLDAGMHRLLVLVVVVASEEKVGELEAEIQGQGEFRAVVVAADHANDALGHPLSAFAPLSTVEPFLRVPDPEKVQEALKGELKAIDAGSRADPAFWEAVQADAKSFLDEGWGEADPWPKSRAYVDDGLRQLQSLPEVNHE